MARTTATCGGSTPRARIYPGLPATAYGARGAGGNTITIVPDHDLVVVLRWHQGNEAEFVLARHRRDSEVGTGLPPAPKATADNASGP